MKELKKKKAMPVRRLEIKKARHGKPEPRAKITFERKVSPHMAPLPSHGFKSHTEKTMPGKPKDLIPWEQDTDKRIAAAANEAFEAEKHFVKSYARPTETLRYVPLSEKLSTNPEKVKAYCEREPWRITDIHSLSSSVKFGTIPARYDVMAKKARKQAKKADKAGNKEAFEKHIDRAVACETAAKVARDVYNNQARKDFRVLAASMDRRAIGFYSESMWTRVFLSLKADGKEYGGKFDGRFFMPDIRDCGSKKLQKAASRVAAARIKWLCLNINEIPLTGYNAPSPKADTDRKGPLLN